MQSVNIKALKQFVKTKLKTLRSVFKLTDPRESPDILLSKIFWLICLSYIVGKNTILSIDHFARNNFIRSFFHSNRPLVASDTTIFRALKSFFNSKELEAINYEIADNDIVKNQLLDPVLKKHCLILDGTSFSKFMQEVAVIPGSIPFILKAEPIVKRGKELVSSKTLLNGLPDNFKNGYFDLILGDGLYYSKNVFKNNQKILGAKTLVKTSEKLSVISDAEYAIRNGNENVQVVTGFDDDKLTGFEIKVVKEINAPTIDGLLQVAIITETYAKSEKKVTFYVITNDLTLTPEELRYAAHLRWVIENNCFKMMNFHMRTKRRISHDETSIKNLIRILFIAINIWNLFLNRILAGNILPKVKITVKYCCEALFYSLIEYSHYP